MTHVHIQFNGFQFCFIITYQQFLYQNENKTHFWINFQSKSSLADIEAIHHHSSRWVRVKERQINTALYFLNDYYI